MFFPTLTNLVNSVSLSKDKKNLEKQNVSYIFRTHLQKSIKQKTYVSIRERTFCKTHFFFLFYAPKIEGPIVFFGSGIYVLHNENSKNYK